MRPRQALCGLVIVVTLACLAPAGTATGGIAPPRLADRSAGWSVEIPQGWKAGRAVAATAFSAGARCRSVSILDGPPPPDSGPAPGVMRSFVQVCAQPRDDRGTLTSFLESLYGPLFPAQFEPARAGGLPAYRSLRSNPALVFLQTGDHRIQIASSVTAGPERRPLRRAQVARILRSFRIERR